MAEEKGIDISDSDISELSPLEELDPEDQVEILPEEIDGVEPEEEVQIESVDQEVADIAVEPEVEPAVEEIPFECGPRVLSDLLN